MLSSLRAAAGGPIAKILLGLLVISFAIWGASGAFIGGTGSSVVSFGETSVGMNDYRLAYDLQANSISRQLGKRLTREQARAFGLDQSVLSQVIAGAVMDENARKMGLGISSDRLAEIIASDASFHDSTGRFSHAMLRQVLRDVGMREEDYVRSRKAVALRRQFLDAVAADVEVPQAFIDAYGAYEAQKRVFDYVTVTADAITQKPEPADSDIEAYYEAHKRDYVAPEYREIVVVRLTADDIARPDLIDQEAVEKEYEARKDNFTTPEKRQIQQLTFKDRAEAQAALDRIRGGETFEQVIANSGRSPNDVDLGLVTEKQVPDVTIAKAAFALKLNETSDIVDGVFGPVLLRVTEIHTAEVKPLAEVADQIRKELALKKATDDLYDVHDRLEDERAAGDTLEEAARKVGLTPRVITAVDREGKAPDGSAVADIPESAQLLQNAFDTDPGVETDPISIGTNGFAWYAVREVTPERQKPLTEVREAVVAAWTEAETAKKVGELAGTIRDRVAKGEKLDAVAAELLPASADGTPAKAETSAEVTRNDANDVLTREALRAGFSIPQGDVTVAPGANAPARIVVQVAKVIEAAPEPLPATISQRVSQSIADDILNAMVADFQSRGEVRINQRAIQTALGS